MSDYAEDSVALDLTPSSRLSLEVESSAVAQTVIESVPRRDSVFYFKTVVFKVESTLFAVTRNSFEVPGTIFEAMFSLPSKDGASFASEGSSDKFPIHLDGISEDHFRGFLGALHPFSSYTMSSEDWIGALHLSTMWEFRKVRKCAITALEPFVASQSVKDKILLAKKYSVEGWLRSGYFQLGGQESLTIEDLTGQNPLDWETIARLLFLRQSPSGLGRLPEQSYYYCPNCCQKIDRVGSCKICFVQVKSLAASELEDTFRIELEGMKEDRAQHLPPLPLAATSSDTPVDGVSFHNEEAKGTVNAVAIKDRIQVDTQVTISESER